MSPDPQERANWVRSALDRFELPLMRYASGITGDAERARDIVQETFLRLCRERPARIADHLAEWLFTVCRNRALSVRRKESRMTTLNEIQVEQRPSPGLNPAEQVERDETSDRIRRLIETLPSKQREVVRLKFQAGLSYKEIGTVANLSVSNVGFLLHTALKTIRHEMAAEESPVSRPLRRIK